MSKLCVLEEKKRGGGSRVQIFDWVGLKSREKNGFGPIGRLFFLLFFLPLRTSQHVPWFQSLRSGNMADAWSIPSALRFGNIIGLGLYNVHVAWRILAHDR